MFKYKENEYYLVDKYNYESTKLKFEVFLEAFKWHMKNKINFSECTIEKNKYNFEDDTIYMSMRTEVISEDYNNCLHFLELGK